MKKETARLILPVTLAPLLPAIPVYVLVPDVIERHWYLLAALGLFMAGTCVSAYCAYIHPALTASRKRAKVIPFPEDFLEKILKENKGKQYNGTEVKKKGTTPSSISGRV